jgi:hypothetical protein
MSQLHISAHFYWAIFRLSFLKRVLYTIDNVLLSTRSIIYFRKCITRSRAQQNIVSCIQYLFKKAHPNLAPQKSAETCSCEIWCEISCNNCLIESCVRLYILYIYILLFTEHKTDVSPENPSLSSSVTQQPTLGPWPPVPQVSRRAVL